MGKGFSVPREVWADDGGPGGDGFEVTVPGPGELVQVGDRLVMIGAESGAAATAATVDIGDAVEVAPEEASASASE